MWSITNVVRGIQDNIYQSLAPVLEHISRSVAVRGNVKDNATFNLEDRDRSNTEGTDPAAYAQCQTVKSVAHDVTAASEQRAVRQSEYEVNKSVGAQGQCIKTGRDGPRSDPLEVKANEVEVDQSRYSRKPNRERRLRPHSSGVSSSPRYEAGHSKPRLSREREKYSMQSKPTATGYPRGIPRESSAAGVTDREQYSETEYEDLGRRREVDIVKRSGYSSEAARAPQTNRTIGNQATVDHDGASEQSQ